MRTSSALAPVLLALLAASGCGTGNAARDVRAVVGRFDAGLSRHAGAVACAPLSDDTRSALEQQEGKPCAKAIAGLGLSPSAVDRVEVEVTSARARLADGESVFLGRTPQGWRIDAVGCKPQPHDEPYDCDLEA